MLFSFAQNQPFVIDGEPVRFSHFNSNGDLLHFENDFRETKSIPEPKFAELVSDQRVRHGQGNSDKVLDERTQRALRDIASFSKNQIQHAMRRRRYVAAIAAAGIPKNREKSWPSIIQSLADNLGEKAPSWQSVARWMLKRTAGDGNLSELVPAFHKCGRREEFRTQEELAFIGKILLKYLESGYSKENIWKEVQDAYRDPDNPCPHWWKLPCRSKIMKMIDRLPARTIMAGRKGNGAARQALQIVGAGPQAYFRLQVVEMDSTWLDLILTDDDGNELGRPNIVVAIDRHTRMLLGHYIGFEKASIYSTIQCLRDAILPKTYVQREYPDITLPWDAFGNPQSVMVDGGPEFNSISFDEVASAMPFTIQLQPVRKPWWKGKVERILRTINQSLPAKLAGATGHGNDDRKPGVIRRH